jgi:hypothetical protein
MNDCVQFGLILLPPAPGVTLQGSNGDPAHRPAQSPGTNLREFEFEEPRLERVSNRLSCQI